MLTTDDSGGLFLSDVSKRDKAWDVHKQQVEIVQALYAETEYQRYSERLNTCSELLGFDWRANDEGEVGLKLQTARFCRVRYCPICQWRRSQMWRARFYQAVPKILEQYPKHRFIFLTLTVQNCHVGELRLTVNKMNSAWSKLRRRKIFPAAGFLKAVEVTRNSNVKSVSFGTAHPHLHVLLMVHEGYFYGRNYISQAKWCEVWQSCLDVDYLPVVNIKAVKPKLYQEHDEALRLALTETLKYSVKPADLIGTGSSNQDLLERDRDWLVTLTEQLCGTKSISVGGILKKYISEDEPEDLIHTEDVNEELKSDNPEIYFGWKKDSKRYKSVSK
jgi:plasmid rolling circle replication initiator protein Rep